MTAWRSPVEIAEHPARHQTVPDEQHHDGADGRGDETGALIRSVVADRLADEGREERAGNAEDGGQDETGRIVGAGRDQAREDTRNEADDDDPDDAAHVRPPSKDSSVETQALVPVFEVRHRGNSYSRTSE